MFIAFQGGSTITWRPGRQEGGWLSLRSMCPVLRDAELSPRCAASFQAVFRIARLMVGCQTATSDPTIPDISEKDVGAGPSAAAPTRIAGMEQKMEMAGETHRARSTKASHLREVPPIQRIAFTKVDAVGSSLE